jgi:hypothetical protein
MLAACPSHAQTVAEVSQFRAERGTEDVLVSVQLQFELPAAVEGALLKGIPMYFVAENELLRERWYWFDKKLATVQRHYRLAYQPLTRRWRLNVTAGSNTDLGPGLALNQTFDTLSEAKAVISRITNWKVADAADLDPDAKYRVEFRFRLDLTQLPRPFQIGALGQSDWDVGAIVKGPLVNAAPVPPPTSEAAK